MGGHNAGDVASQRAVEVVRAHLAARPEALQAFAEDPSPARGAAAAHLVEEAIQAACADIHRLAAGDPKLTGMGTTFVCLVVAGERAVVAHVGDSRLYLFRSGAVHVLTEDHTLVAAMIKTGEVTAEGAKNSPFKGRASTRALGQQRFGRGRQAGGRPLPRRHPLLLCSDGLYGYLDDARARGAARLAGRRGEADLPAGLVTVANERGGRDNITAVVVSLQRPRGGRARGRAIGRGPHRRAPSHPALRAPHLPRAERGAGRGPHPAPTPSRRHLHRPREGEPGGDLFVAPRGQGQRRAGAGSPSALVTAGGHFGEMGLVDAGPGSASVRARRADPRHDHPPRRHAGP